LQAWLHQDVHSLHVGGQFFVDHSLENFDT